MRRAGSVARIGFNILSLGRHRRGIEKANAIATKIDYAQRFAIEEERLMRKSLLLTLLVAAHIVVRENISFEPRPVDTDRSARR